MNDGSDKTREFLESSPALKHSALTEKIIAAFYEVYNELGFGFLESVYCNALAIAAGKRGLTVEREVPIAVWYGGIDVGDFKADLIVEGTVLLELKTAQALDINRTTLFNKMRKYGLLAHRAGRPISAS